MPDDAEGADSTTLVVTFIICAHNSAEVIEDTIETVVKRLADTPAEIIVVENGSTDGTGQILDRLVATWPVTCPTLRVVRAPKGFGHAARAGILCSTGAVVVIAADDLPFGFDDLDAAQRLGYPPNMVLIGSKGHPESEINGRRLVRAVLTGGFRVLCRLALGLRTRDPQGEFVLDGAWVRSLTPALRETGFLFSTEIVYAAELSGIRPTEVPVRLRESSHGTRIRLSDVRKMGFGLLRLRRRRAALRAAAMPLADPVGRVEEPLRTRPELRARA